jgi:hypothetical protein
MTALRFLGRGDVCRTVYDVVKAAWLKKVGDVDCVLTRGQAVLTFRLREDAAGLLTVLGLRSVSIRLLTRTVRGWGTWKHCTLFGQETDNPDGLYGTVADHARETEDTADRKMQAYRNTRAAFCVYRGVDPDEWILVWKVPRHSPSRAPVYFAPDFVNAGGRYRCGAFYPSLLSTVRGVTGVESAHLEYVRMPPAK